MTFLIAVTAFFLAAKIVLFLTSCSAHRWSTAVNDILGLASGIIGIVLLAQGNSVGIVGTIFCAASFAVTGWCGTNATLPNCTCR